jgi:hypothetical protein
VLLLLLLEMVLSSLFDVVGNVIALSGAMWGSSSDVVMVAAAIWP